MSGPSVTALLARRVRVRGADPLLTYYDVDSGERTELSAASYANWVAKTANLLVEELFVDPGERVHLALARTHPGHWVTLVWELACWQVGAVVSLGDEGSAATVVVVAPGAERITAADVPVLVCSLHPLGLPLPERPTAPVLDYTLEVRGQPDHFVGPPIDPGALAWLDGPLALRHDDLATEGRPDGIGRRRLLRPADPWTVTAALVEALRTDGSLVLVTGEADSDQLARIASQENAIVESARC